MSRARLVLMALLGLSAGCHDEKSPTPLVERAAFGVFFGGQIQDRRELPFELDTAKQSVGIRIDFKSPPAREIPVAWEIARPLRGKAADGGGERVVELGDARARVGEPRLDVPILLRAGQLLGVWHVRVRVDGQVALDRDVLVFDPKRALDGGQ
jgi:hypothetical protein